MKIKSTTIGLLLLNLAFVFAYYNLTSKIGKKVAVVDLQEMYASFDLTKQIDRKYQAISKERDIEIDSLTAILQQIEKEEYEDQVLIKNIYQKIQFAQLQKEDTKVELEQQIWTQLNQYLNDFGEQTDFALIHGSMNRGDIIYAEDPIDITEEVINYINLKYQGI